MFLTTFEQPGAEGSGVAATWAFEVTANWSGFPAGIKHLDKVGFARVDADASGTAVVSTAVPQTEYSSLLLNFDN